MGTAALPSLCAPSLSSHTCQWEPQTSRGVHKILLPGLIPAPDLVHAGVCFNPAWQDLPTLSALAGEYCSLAQPGTAYTLSWLLCMPAGAMAFSCPDPGAVALCLLPDPGIQMLMSVAALSSLAHPQTDLAFHAPQREL